MAFIAEHCIKFEHRFFYLWSKKKKKNSFPQQLTTGAERTIALPTAWAKCNKLEEDVYGILSCVPTEQPAVTQHSSSSIVHPNGLIRQILRRKIVTWKWFQEKYDFIKGWLQIPLRGEKQALQLGCAVRQGHLEVFCSLKEWVSSLRCYQGMNLRGSCRLESGVCVRMRVRVCASC